MYRDSNSDRRDALERLVNALPAMVAYWDATLHCRFANRAYEKWFGVTPEAMLGRDMKEFLGPLFELNRPFVEGALRGEEQQFEREIPDPHGGPARFAQAHYMPDIVEGVVRGFSVLVADITRRRQAEQALTEMERKVHANERLAAVATLAAGTAHELNNPLAAVLANIDFGLERLERGDVGQAELHTVLVEAREAARRARGILRNMSMLARGEVTSRESVDVVAAIETSLQLAAPAYRYKARVVRDCGKSLTVLANTAQLIQVFVNLLINAAQALPEGATTNVIRIVARGEANTVIVEVHDNGCGIPADHLERVFEPFFTTKSLGAGMGLGLSIALGIVRSFGGTLALRSEPGAGSVFSLSLPAAPPLASIRAEPPPARVPAVSAPARPRILIVDDEKLITRTLQRALESDLDVTTVDSGPAALAILAAPECAIDVVLCDLMMPGMTGQAVYTAAVAARPRLRGHFVIMTGGAFTPRGQEFLATFDGPVIKKPFDLSEVRATIVATLAGRS